MGRWTLTPLRSLVLSCSMAAAACATTATPSTSPSPSSTQRPLRLTILHNNDGESQLLDAGSGLTDWGGVARFKSAVDRLRAAARAGDSAERAHDVLVLSSGDNILPGPELTASQTRGVPLYDGLALQMIGYDAICLGNHDFDLGPDLLADLIESTPRTQTWLSANLDFAKEPRLAAVARAGRLASRAIVTLSTGHRVGVIGLTTPTLASISTPRNVTIDPDLPAVVAREVASLEQEGVRHIILVSHLQSIAADVRLVKELSGVDLVIAGGGDELLANPSTALVPGDEAAPPRGDYPLRVPDRDAKLVPLVTTPGSYRYVGRLVVDMDGAGAVVGVAPSSGLVRIAGGAAPDASAEDPTVIREVTGPLTQALRAQRTNVVGTTEVPLVGVRAKIRAEETNLGNLVADALAWYATQVAKEHGVSAPRVALVNGGGIRNDSVLPVGDLTELDTFNILPFPNSVSVAPEVPATKLAEILGHAARHAGRGAFLQVSGLVVTHDRDEGDLLDVTLADGTAIVRDGRVVAGAPAVGVATISFLAKGGGGAPFEGLTYSNLGASYQQALARYIETGLSGRITAARYPRAGSGRIIAR